MGTFFNNRQEKMENLKYELIYFNSPGRGGPIRQLFYKLGVEFTDTTIDGATFGKLKGSGELPFGSVPILKVTRADGTVQTIAQSNAILTFVAKQHGGKF